MRGDARAVADDHDVQLAAGAEAVPPGAQPLVAQERVRHAGALDGVVPLGLETRRTSRSRSTTSVVTER